MIWINQAMPIFEIYSPLATLYRRSLPPFFRCKKNDLNFFRDFEKFNPRLAKKFVSTDLPVRKFKSFLTSSQNIMAGKLWIWILKLGLSSKFKKFSWTGRNISFRPIQLALQRLNKSKSSILKNSQTFVCQEKWCFAAKSLDQFWEACPWLNQFSYSMAALTTNSQNYNLFNIFDQFTP